MPQWAGSSWYFLRYMRPAQRRGARLARRRWNTGCRWTGTTAAWSTPRCICCTAGSGTSSCTTSAWCPPASRMPEAHQPRHDPGRKRREDVQDAAATWSTRTISCETTARTPCACTRCSSAILKRARPGTPQSIKGCTPLFGARLEPGGSCLWTATAIRRNWKARCTRTIKKVGEDIEVLKIEHRHRRHDEPAQRDLRQKQPSPAASSKRC